MYVPAHFAVTECAALHEFIDRHPFGLLVSQLEGAPFATHLPLLLDREAAPNGALVGHVARQNPQWHGLADQTALCVFSGAHAYISPTWYQSDKVVPTWNYVAVHVYGRVRLVDEPAPLVSLVRRLTERFERDMPVPWRFGEGEPYVERLATQIVGFQLEIERIEGKWKLNQNHPAERRRSVIAGLREQGYGDAREIAALMERGLTA